MAVVIYARKSSESKDRQVQSLDDQVRILKELALRERIEVSETIRESKSAMKPGTRPEFSRMIHRVEEGEIDGILAWNLDRLSRNSRESGHITQLLFDEELKYIRTPYTTYLPGDDLLRIMMENAMAANYSVNLRNNVRRGMLSKCDKGWYPSAAPVGYRNNRQTREIDPDPVMFKLFRKAWDMLLANGTTVAAIHREMALLGLGSYRKGRYCSPMTKAAIFKAFDNPFYYGMIRYGGKIYQGKHRPMVTKSEFMRAQEILGKPMRICPKTLSFIYSGTMRCGICGCAVVGERKIKRNNNTGSEKTYTYYHCSGAKGCPKTGIEEKSLIESILRTYDKNPVTDELIEYADQCLRKSLQRELEAIEAGNTNAENEIRAFEAKRNRIRKLFIDGDLEPGEYKECVADIDASIEGLQKNLTESEVKEDAVREKVITVLHAYQTLGSPEVLETDEAKTGLRTLGDNHTLTQGKLRLNPSPLVGIFTALEPPKRCSTSGKLVVTKAQDKLWWSSVNKARNFVRTELPE